MEIQTLVSNIDNVEEKGKMSTATYSCKIHFRLKKLEELKIASSNITVVEFIAWK